VSDETERRIDAAQGTAPVPGSHEPVDPDIDLDVPEQRRELTAPGGAAVLVAIAVGGIIGAEARYGLGLAWPHATDGWPWSTLVINTSGCLLIGVLMVLITERFTPHPLLRPLVGVGVLGGYTTFSTFTVDIIALAVHGRPLVAIGYLLVTPVAALSAVWIGASITRRVAVDRAQEQAS
jgi:CrcB protein